MRARLAQATILTVLALLLSACGGDDSESSSEGSTSSDSSYVPVSERPEEERPDIPLPLDLDRIVEQLEQDGFEVTAVRPNGVLGEVHVEGGVVVTQWSDEARRDRYLKLLEKIRAEREPTEVLFESEGLIVVWLDRDGEPTADERAAYDAAVSAAQG